MKIRRSIPDYVHGVDRITVEYENQEQLLNIEFVKNFTEILNFSYFAIHEREQDYLLIAVFGEGYEWWVVGFMDSIKGLDFIKWEAKYKDKVIK